MWWGWGPMQTEVPGAARGTSGRPVLDRGGHLAYEASEHRQTEVTE